ncbi:XdhC family protein [Rubrobacter aplysinae]|uniref:XdhC family protein n=1 Tax=Rubrobacter aplysinae TaxID=909625 RepID=UPI00064BE5AD|nr:XdhC/CoxI family protein [Rubrobacter aplysinae]
MNPVVEKVAAWSEAGKKAALATVVKVERSGPLGPGTMMAVNEDGQVVGSVSGGCVEPAVFEECMAAIEGGGAKLVTYGISDDEAFGVGLTCGGIIHIFVEPVADDGQAETLRRALSEQSPIAVATVIHTAEESGVTPGGRLLVTPEAHDGELDDEELERAVADGARGMLEGGQTGQRHYGPRGQRRMEDVTVFVNSFAPPPRMYVFGAIDFAGAVAKMGKFMGYRVTVCDARPVFATRERFPSADEVVVSWPDDFLQTAEVDGRTVICVLTHDPKFDVPVLKAALDTEAGYIGAMGSRRTHEDRTARLREEGVTDEQLSRIASPVGLDLGSRTPEETAVAISAEIIALRTGHEGGRLADRSGPIHAAGFEEANRG